ncbi:MAG: hypothetical protein AAF653_11225 [Chloroflexota bacterium]
MCRYLTVIEKNEHKQVIFICEHDTLHISHKHTVIVLTRAAFYQLDDLLRSDCSLNRDSVVNQRITESGQIELWIGDGAFRMTSVEMTAFTHLVERCAEKLRHTPLSAMLKPAPNTGWSAGTHVDFSVN